MDPCVAGAARIITPPAWLCRSWSRPWFWASVGWARLQSSDGRYGLRLLKPLFQATTDPKLLFQAPKQLRTATLFQPWGRVEARWSPTSAGLCSNIHLFTFAFWWLQSHNKNTETRKYIWLCVKELKTFHFLFINEEMRKKKTNWAFRLRRAVFLWRSRFSRDAGWVHLVPQTLPNRHSLN